MSIHLVNITVPLKKKQFKMKDLWKREGLETLRLTYLLIHATLFFFLLLMPSLFGD